MKHSWVDWLVEKTPEIESVHRKVVEKVFHYHRKKLPRCADIYADMTDNQRSQVDQYGVSGLLEFYKPHTTLFYGPQNPSLEETSKSLNVSYHMSCPLEAVIIGKLGYYGNITEILYEKEF